ncbi:MAG: di-trans,poly-cis-decaprenylcistransferase [Candidatus Aenigmatarchaeota archaeon]|nr:MAG: di-trans,poly-cis-decaprenylcistransferase [Candidatus Aenigmarchaeota archaeon]
MLKHLAIIPDGNRRYAKKAKIQMRNNYKNSIEKTFDIVGWCVESKISVLTIWGFSTENWKRSNSEKKVLFKLFEEKATELLLDERLVTGGIQIKVIGDKKQFSKKLQSLFCDIEEKTKKNKKLKLNLLLNYGGRYEILSAINNLLKESKKNVDEKTFKKYLWLSEEPDLIIRTSGEHRLSGLLPFQSVYSELYFEPKYFPEFEKKDFNKAIKSFNNQSRRFGK